MRGLMRWVCGIGVFGWSVCAAAEGGEALLERLITHHQGWGELGIDACAHAQGTEPLPLRIGVQSYERGIGTHSPGELVFMLEGEFERFTADVGVQPQQHGSGSVVFRFLVDGTERFSSGVLREKDAPVPVSIDLAGADELRIVVEDAGDGIMCDVANIGDPSLVRAANAQASGIARLDIAPFARVMTWAPEEGGTATERTGPFIAEDVYMGMLVEPDADGTWEIPIDEEGTGCIGLEWAERRLLREVALHVNDAALLPALDTIRVKVWAGESPWQGDWHDVKGPLMVEGDRVSIRIATPKDAAGQGHEKVCWIIPESPAALRVTRLEAQSFSRVRDARVRIETASTAPVAIEVYNGYVTEGPMTVNAGKPVQLELRIADARLWKGDRTALRFDVAEQPVAVAVDDVLRTGKVYVPSAGVLVASENTAMTLADARAEAEGKETLLAKVRAMPDQTLEQAFEHVHNPIQDLGPMMVSLAADNRKFVAHRNGAVAFHAYERPDDTVPNPDGYIYRVETRIDGEVSEPDARTLAGGWLPAPEMTWQRDGVTYTQRVFVCPLDRDTVDDAGWLHAQAACVVDIEARVEGGSSAPVDVESRFAETNRDGAAFEAVGTVYAALADNAVRAVAVGDASSALQPVLEDGRVALRGTLEPGSAARMRVLLPAWRVERAAAEVLARESDYHDTLTRYWERVLGPAMQVEAPDTFLTNLIRASQVHILLAARNEDSGGRIAAWISADRYGPFESEAHSVIRGMDLHGHDNFARKSLDFFIRRYAPEGYLTTGYTLMGTGWHLWTLADYVARSGNTAWFESVAPEVARVCRWIVDERQKTMDHGEFSMPDTHPSAECPPECGLMPPTVAADWNRYAYRFVQEGHYYAGLKQAARALASIGYPEAERFESEAEALREATLRAYRYTQGRAPAQALDTGAWIPAYPGMLYSFGRIEDIIPGEDWNRSWCYDVELGAHHLAALGVLDPQSEEVGDMLEHMEEFWFLHQGLGDYPPGRNRADWYNLGGFAKVQPYYARNAELYAWRDDVKPFIRSYFNSIPTLVSRENLSFWEHFHNIGGWNKTHETGYFLAQSREMLVQERGDTLWIAPLVPEHWLVDGARIAVTNAPTQFGRIDFVIESHVADGEVRARLHPQFRHEPSAVVLRVRHPEGLKVSHGTTSGNLVPSGDGTTVVLAPPFTTDIEVRVAFQPR